MDISASTQGTKSPMLPTAIYGGLAVGSKADQQLMQLESNAFTFLITTEVTTLTTARLQHVDGSPTSNICAAEKKIRKSSPLTVPDEQI